MRRGRDWQDDHRPCPKCRRTDIPDALGRSGAVFRPRSEVRADGTHARRQICVACNAKARKAHEMKMGPAWSMMGFDAYGRLKRLRAGVR